ncbi:hypothetical protein JXA34_02465 [Patescibacteria group bacterium]|nr:hypothetical protein [Patescibacteria group bacterium]
MPRKNQVSTISKKSSNHKIKIDERYINIMLAALLSALFTGSAVYWLGAFNKRICASNENSRDKILLISLKEEVYHLKNEVAELNNKINLTADINQKEEVEYEGFEKTSGYIHKVLSDNGNTYINIDYINWFMGKEAKEAAMEDTGCALENIGDDNCAPTTKYGYYIRNIYNDVLTVALESDTIIELLDNDLRVKEHTVDEFKKLYENQDGDYLKEKVFNIFSSESDGTVARITEQNILRN